MPKSDKMFFERDMVTGLTDAEISGILGWDTKDFARIRAKYVSDAPVVVAIDQRIAAAKSA